MSIQTVQSNIGRIRREIADLEKQASDETRKEVDKSKQITQITQSIDKYTSQSSIRSKQQQVSRLSDEVARIQSKRADISKKIAEKTSQLHRYQQDLAKEEERERKKVEDAERRRQREQLEYQRTLTRELREQRNLAEESFTSPYFNNIEQIMSMEYDVFISHASEDKDEFVRPLAHALEHLGFKVWYDEFQLKIGDSLRRSIDRGLAHSRYGIVVLSSNFFAKNWPQYELDGMIAREMNGIKVVLPIWHKVSKDEVLSYSPTLADKVALNSSIYSIDEIAVKLAEVLRG